MSSKKITDADKLEIVDLYRLAGDTTASLASRFGVSNSTISRLLKTNIPEAEYEVLIQQKRGSKVGIEEESATTDEPMVVQMAIPPELVVDNNPSQPDTVIPNREDPAPLASTLAEPDRDLVPSIPASNIEEDSNTSRRVRRRSSAPLAAAIDEPTASNQSVTKTEPIPVAVEIFVEPIPVAVEIAEVAISDVPSANNTDIYTTDPSPKIPVQPPIPRTPALREILSDSKDRYSNPPAPEPIVEIFTDEFEEDSDSEDVNALAAMFGEEIADGDDDDEFAEEDWDEEPTSADEQVDRNQFLTEDRLNVQVTPLSKATLPRTCYIVIDKFAELIVRPLKDFADLGQISGEEIQQRTLPVFDNHRVAKRFSNQRTQRVIKVPDSRVFYKTTQQLRSKGITCLLVDGNIYSLN
ncbi:transposase [Chamaesiphon sp.]|uniref:transposase n=1 Tax=Chamaesiphon sp. TaxID=2814140 RepID=UPI003593B309